VVGFLSDERIGGDRRPAVARAIVSRAQPYGELTNDE
jgi:hypothetical protein